MKDYEIKPFTPTRSPIGRTVPVAELVKRIAYELQIPQSYGIRVLRAYSNVINDALAHGEGLNLKTVTLRLVEHPTRYHDKGYTKGEKRKMMYKYKAGITDYGKEVIEQLTKKNFDGI